MKTMLVLLVSAFLLLGCVGYGGTQNSSPTAIQSNTPTATAIQTSTPGASVSPSAIPSQTTAASVDISGFAFSPAELTVAKGTSVTWTNKDSAAHTVTSTSGAFDSGSLSNGGSWTFTFNTPGTYDYRCSFHGSMNGKIIVTG